MAELHLLSPLGFSAAGVYAGIKSTQTPDIGMLVCDGDATAAALFTTNRVFAAPVKIGREHIREGKLRGVVVNAGNANACTGRQGERDARRMCQVAGAVAGCTARRILPSSTGIIGRLLPMALVERGIAEAGQNLGKSQEHAALFSQAILTTDTRRKFAAVEFSSGRMKVRIAGACKGSGMIGPRLSLGSAIQPAPGKLSKASPKNAKAARHATMLAYLTTDADITAPSLRKLLAAAGEVSFNAVTVDDHTSTNDTVCVMASGGSGVKIGSPATLKAFGAAMDEVCQSLAYQIAADGEGATKVVVVRVRKARAVSDARAMARAIANSPLVKCAMHGNDPNWGRIVSAAGLAGVAFEPDRCVLTLQGAQVFRRGQPLEFDAAAISASLDAPEVQVDLCCNLGSSDATCWTCDLSKEYVTINADYHT